VGAHAVLGAAGPDRVRDRRDFVSIPNGHIIYAVAGLGIFGAFTIYDFNRLRRSTPDAAVPIAASIFLDVFNVFLLALELFGGQRD
jgi:FtsH-binding integral membrane protein